MGVVDANGGGFEKNLHPRQVDVQDLEIAPQQRQQSHLNRNLLGRGEMRIGGALPGWRW